jgi:hypothetical protein
VLGRMGGWALGGAAGNALAQQGLGGQFSWTSMAETAGVAGVAAGLGPALGTLPSRLISGSRSGPVTAFVDSAESETTLYRAVSLAERADIEAFGGFRAGPNSYEGKLFAMSAEDSARFGRINHALTPGGEPFHIVETRVSTSLAETFERLTTDRMQAIHVAKYQLNELNASGQWSYWNAVPYVGKPGGGL